MVSASYIAASSIGIKMLVTLGSRGLVSNINLKLDAILSCIGSLVPEKAGVMCLVLIFRSDILSDLRQCVETSPERQG